MLSNLLANIEKIIRAQFEFNDSTIDGLIEMFKNYKKGMWIYPGILKRKFGLSISNAYLLLQSLAKDGILESYYELYCGHCQKVNGEVYKTFNELPETFECEHCNEELPSVENAVIIFKVLKDE